MDGSMKQWPALPSASIAVQEQPVVIVTNEFHGLFKNGGIGTANTGLAYELAASGYAVTVAYVGFNSSNPADVDRAKRIQTELSVRGVKLEFILPPANIWNAFSDARSTSFAIYQYLAARKFSAIYFNDCGGHGYYTCLAKRSGLAFSTTTVVVVMHGPHEWLSDINYVRYYNSQPIIISYMERRSSELADVVISPSNYLLNYLTDRGWRFPPQTYMAQNIVNVDISTTSKNLLRLSQPVNEIVFFGRQEVRKGLKIFCDAVDLLQNTEASGLPIRIMGKFSIVDGLHSGAYVLERSRRWRNSVNFSVMLGQSEATAYISRPGRVAVMPSLAENSPCVVAECLQLGIRFLSTDSGGTAELVDEAGRETCLVAPTAKDLAEGLLALTKEPCSVPEMAIPQEETKQTWISFHSNRAERETASEPADEVLPLVTACLVHFNNPKYLAQSLKSVYNQTYKNLELVIVDDGSTNAEAIRYLQEIEESDPPIPVSVVYQKNSYLGAARNTAVRHASGELFLFIDDDNVWMPHCVESMVKAMQNLDCDIITGVSYHFKHDNFPTEKDNEIVYVPIGGCVEVGALENCYGDANALVSRDAYELVGGFHEDYGQAVEDWEFFATAALKGARIEVCPVPTFWYRVRTASMLNKSNLLQNHRRILNVYSKFSAENLVRPMEGLLSIENDYYYRNQSVFQRYSNVARQKLLEVSRTDPNGEPAMKLFFEFLLEAGFVTEALDFALHNSTDLVPMAQSRSRAHVRDQALEAVRAPTPIVEELIDLTSEAGKRFKVIQGVPRAEPSEADIVGAVQISHIETICILPGLRPPGAHRIEADVLVRGYSGDGVHAAFIDVPRGQDVDLTLTARWTELADQNTTIILDIADPTEQTSDLALIIRVDPGIVLPSSEVVWDSLRAWVQDDPILMRRRLNLVDRYEELSEGALESGKLLTDTSGVEFAIFNPHAKPILLHPVHERVSMVRFKACAPADAKGVSATVGLLNENSHPVEFAIWLSPTSRGELLIDDVLKLKCTSGWQAVTTAFTQTKVSVSRPSNSQEEHDIYIATRVRNQENVYFCHAVWHSIYLTF